MLLRKLVLNLIYLNHFLDYRLQIQNITLHNVDKSILHSYPIQVLRLNLLGNCKRSQDVEKFVEIHDELHFVAFLLYRYLDKILLGVVYRDCLLLLHLYWPIGDDLNRIIFVSWQHWRRNSLHWRSW